MKKSPESPVEHALRALQVDLTAAGIERVLRTALRKGGALAELFFEETASTRVIYEGGKIDQVIDGTDRGAGLRVIFDGRSVYGYTTDLGEPSLLSLAEALSEAVTGQTAGVPKAIEWGVARQPAAEILAYKIGQSPRAIPIQQKIDIAAPRRESRARGAARGPPGHLRGARFPPAHPHLE